MSIFLKTKRLVLKPMALSDIDNLFALRSDPEVMKYIGDGTTHTREKVQDFIECGLGSKIPTKIRHYFLLNSEC